MPPIFFTMTGASKTDGTQAVSSWALGLPEDDAAAAGKFYS